MANNFLVYEDFKVGKSLIEKNTKKIIKKIYEKADKNECKVIIPEDCVVSTYLEGDGKNKKLDKIEENEIILDIGPNTVKKLRK